MCLLAVDIGASKIAALLTNLSKDPLVFQLNDTHSPVDQMNHFCLKLKEYIKQLKQTVKRCVVASAPFINDNGLIERWPSRNEWVGLNIKSFFYKLLRCPIYFEDDANAAAYAEAKIRKTSHLVYIGIGSGLGGGFILNNEIYRGGQSDAFDLGHIIVNRNGPYCQCGKKGCLQTYVSGKAISKKILGTSTITSETYYQILDRIQSYPKKKKEFLINLAYLNQTITNINTLFKPKHIVLGGGFTFVLSDFIFNLIETQQSTLIESATFGFSSSLIGAQYLVEDCKTNSISI